MRASVVASAIGAICAAFGVARFWRRKRQPEIAAADGDGERCKTLCLDSRTGAVVPYVAVQVVEDIRAHFTESFLSWWSIGEASAWLGGWKKKTTHLCALGQIEGPAALVVVQDGAVGVYSNATVCMEAEEGKNMFLAILPDMVWHFGTFEGYNGLEQTLRDAYGHSGHDLKDAVSTYFRQNGLKFPPGFEPFICMQLSELCKSFPC